MWKHGYVCPVCLLAWDVRWCDGGTTPCGCRVQLQLAPYIYTAREGRPATFTMEVTLMGRTFQAIIPWSERDLRRRSILASYKAWVNDNFGSHHHPALQVAFDAAYGGWRNHPGDAWLRCAKCIHGATTGKAFQARCIHGVEHPTIDCPDFIPRDRDAARGAILTLRGGNETGQALGQ